MSTIRRCVPDQFYQGVDEEKSYNVNVGAWMAAPTSACAVIKEGTTDRTASNFQYGGSLGAASAIIASSIITTPCLVSLRDGVD